MSIRPIDFNGMIQRTGDVGAVKRNEDAKVQTDQANITQQLEHQEDEQAHQVQGAEESPKAGTDADAKEEGKGEYTPSGRKKTPPKKKPAGRVVKKTGGSFDIKI